jgi:hypothetical protein
MYSASLSSCIVQSLKEREMVAQLPDALLSHNRSQTLRHDEGEYWDYKEQLRLESSIEVARLAKRVLGFHNAKGGVLVIGVDDNYRVLGVPESQAVDTNVLHGKLRKYIGPTIQLFQDTIKVPNERVLWLIFIPKRESAPVSVLTNGPLDETGRSEIRRNEYYVRVNDEVKLCVEPSDYERLFSGVTMSHLQAYLYDIDEPYYRLLAPHCDLFVGRTEVLLRANQALRSRHPVVALDGVGGVGKSAVAIELVRQLYESKKYMFIVSQSAKSSVWHGYTGSRRASFSGLTEFLQEVAQVLQIPTATDLEELKKSVVDTMKGVEGLLLIDNIEDIRDRSVLQFLSLEVPEPVKVLITSRIDRGLGALTVSVPQMDEAEARKLLFHELERIGYRGFIDEPEWVAQILRVTGCLPLALKWAAGLSGSLGSLEKASNRLKKLDSKKREFLNFCFATMYDELSVTARDTAALCPYLGEEWNVATVSVALDRPESEIEQTTQELEDRGIVLASSSARKGAMRLLPLTVDCLATKWRENAVLRGQVSNRLADAIGSTDYEGTLLNWPVGQRVQVLCLRADQLRAGGDLKRARQLTRVALSWSSDPQLLFLEGRILFESGKKAEGISSMRAAIQVLGATAPIDARLILASALLDHGGNHEGAEALHLLEESIPRDTGLAHGQVDAYCRLALELREYTSISKVLGKTTNNTYLRWMLETLKPALGDRMVVYSCGQSLLSALRTAAKARDISEDDRQHYEREVLRIASMLNQQSTRDVS